MDMLIVNPQPPSGGCVLKQQAIINLIETIIQPPSGGCVLKPSGWQRSLLGRQPAAFGRLCVETLK